MNFTVMTSVKAVSEEGHILGCYELGVQHLFGEDIVLPITVPQSHLAFFILKIPLALLFVTPHI